MTALAVTPSRQSIQQAGRMTFGLDGTLYVGDNVSEASMHWRPAASLAVNWNAPSRSITWTFA